MTENCVLGDNSSFTGAFNKFLHLKNECQLFTNIRILREIIKH